MKNTINELIENSLSRIQEATLGVLNLTDNGLRQHLREQMVDELGSTNCFLAQPVIEHTFPWQTSEETLQSLCQQGMLSPKLLKVLDKEKINGEKNKYRFPKNAQPYRHQLQAWRHLLQDTPKSAIVTSGTGSGKTECFMIPMLQDLITQQEKLGSSLIGVYALFLYPLNALINSQKERLNAWTQDFGKDIRYCLYNGNTREFPEQRDKDTPNEILSRELLRKEPAPILLTNATMLEYMLVRQADAPIIQQSKQKQTLRWIVLDEAHSYVGSQAAEIALLLRRVVQAFGKRPQDIRFVATSATIADKDAAEQLRHYLADLAGVSPEQIDVVSGSREFERLNIGNQQTSFDDIVAMDAEQTVSLARYQALTHHAVASRLRHTLTESTRPCTLNELVNVCAGFLRSGSLKTQQREILSWLDVMTQTRATETSEPFLKLRLHLFR